MTINDPYQTPSSEEIVKLKGSEFFADKFDKSRMGKHFLTYRKLIWSVWFVLIIATFLIVYWASPCDLSIGSGRSTCVVAEINIGPWASFLLAFFIPITLAISIINWLIRQVLLFVFTFKY